MFNDTLKIIKLQYKNVNNTFWLNKDWSTKILLKNLLLKFLSHSGIFF